MKEWFRSAIEDALTSFFGWTATMFVTLVAAYCTGYWVAHGRIVEFERTLTSFLFIPFLWLFYSKIVFAYLVLFLSWYYPLRVDFPWLKIGGVVSTFLIWSLMIHDYVSSTANAKIVLISF